jgi:hypothetical protein
MIGSILSVLGLLLLVLFATNLTVNESHGHKVAVQVRLALGIMLMIFSILFGYGLA